MIMQIRDGAKGNSLPSRSLLPPCFSNRKKAMIRDAREVIVEKLGILKALFCTFDVTDEGTVGKDGLGEIFNLLGEHVSKNTIDDMFLEFDVDENKSLDFGEVLSLMSRFYNNSSEQDCLDAFVWFLNPHNGEVQK